MKRFTQKQAETRLTLHVLIVDDHEADAGRLKEALQDLRLEVSTVNSGEAALETVLEGETDALVLENVLPGMGGKELVERILSQFPLFPVLVWTKYGNLQDAFEYAQLGAFAYELKEGDIKRFAEKVQLAALGDDSLEKEIVPGMKKRPFHQFVTQNVEMERLFRTAMEKVARAPSTVLITGESGQGRNCWRKRFIITVPVLIIKWLRSIVRHSRNR